MDQVLHLKVAGRFPTLLDLVEARTGRATETAWWGPVIGADEPLQDFESGTVWWGPIIGADEPITDDSSSSFLTLIDIIEAKIGRTTGTVWWGPVIGADEALPDDLSSGLEIVSDEPKRVPLTVCEDG